MAACACLERTSDGFALCALNMQAKDKNLYSKSRRRGEQCGLSTRFVINGRLPMAGRIIESRSPTGVIIKFCQLAAASYTESTALR